MALFRNMNKTPRVMETLKQIKSRFLLTPERPETQMPVCSETKLGNNYIEFKPLHQNSILRMQYHPINLHSRSAANYYSTAKFHHLAENALMAWAITKKNADVAGQHFTRPDSFNGMRNYAKDVDKKGASSEADDKKQTQSPMSLIDYEGDARYAEAKRILKEKRITKRMEETKKSPFNEM